MRILVSADTHLGSPIRSIALRNRELGERLKQLSRDTFVDIINLAITEQVDALVLAGDIFDNAYPDIRTRTFLMNQLSRLAEAGIQTMLIRGNHDALLNHQDLGDLGKDIHLLHKANPTVELGNTAFHGLSFDKAHVDKSFLPDYPVPLQGKRNVGLMHTSLDGAAGHDPYAPCAERDLVAHGFDLWCLGHIHAPFERIDDDVLLVMPGIPQPRHFGEHKGGTVTLVSLDQVPPAFERRVVSKLGFVECMLDLNTCADQAEVMRTIRTALMNAKDPQRDIAVRLSVSSDNYSTTVLSAQIDEVLEDIEGVFLDKLKSAPAVRATDAENDDLMRFMKEEVATDGYRQSALQHLQTLRDALPAEIKNELDDGELDTLLEEAMTEVVLHLRSGAAQ